MRTWNKQFKNRRYVDWVSKEQWWKTTWPSEPIKALGVFFTYDQSLLYEKNFQDKLDNMNKLTNIWSSRGLSIYGKVTIIKSLLIPKLMYVSSLLPPPSNIIKQVNHIIFTFLWKGKDKMTRLSAINTLEEGGIKMIDIESMIKALRLAWLKRILNNNDITWKYYLIHLLKQLGDLLIFECNYEIKDLPTISTFYRCSISVTYFWYHIFIFGNHRFSTKSNINK